MNMIIYPSEQVLNTYLCIGYSVEMYVSYNGETVIICNSNEERPSKSFLAEKGHDYINLNEFFKISLNNDDAQWDFICPLNYKKISDNLERQQRFYIDGMSKISEALSNLNYFVNIRISRNHLPLQELHYKY